MDTTHFLKRSIVELTMGSHAHGTNNIESDKDIRGIFVAPESYTRTPFLSVELIEKAPQIYVENGILDFCFFELSRFMTLISKQRFNAVEMLFTDRAQINFSTPPFELLRSNRSLLLSKELIRHQIGVTYGKSMELQRMIQKSQIGDGSKPHKKDYFYIVHDFTPEQTWINSSVPFNGFSAEYINDDMYVLYQDASHTWFTDNEIFVFTEKPEVRPQSLIRFILDKWRTTKPPQAIVSFDRKRYKTDMDRWEKSEPSTKFFTEIYNIIRVARTVSELDHTNNLQIKRPDGAELLEIKRGEWTLDRLYEHVTELNTKLKNLEQTSKLPEQVSTDLLVKLTMQIQDMMW